MQVRGDLVYVANDANGLLVLDASDPYNLHLIGRHPQADGYAHSLALAVRPSWCKPCALLGSWYSRQLKILDVRQPQLIGDPVLYESPDRRVVHGGVATAVDGTRAVVVADGVDYNSIEIVDLGSLPGPPVRLGALQLPVATYGSWGNVKMTGGIVYWAASRWLPEQTVGGLRVIDARNPSQPRLVGRLDLPDIGHVPWEGTGLETTSCGRNTYAYMVGKTALHVIDVSRSSRPREVARYPLPPEFGAVLGGNVVVRDGIAYVAAYSENGTGGLAIYKLRHGFSDGPHAVTN